jgi:tRNA-(ms[2]io[6]A)-hydroxylase
MLCLRSQTQDAWLERACSHTAEILVDHAHCERKAATQALTMLARFPDKPELVAPMIALAREELEHFELVMTALPRYGGVMEAQVNSGYQTELHAAVRKEMPGKLIDLLLVAGLIEARSCERFKLLSEHHPDADLRAFFRSLLESEARHHATFVRLAEGFADRDSVRQRLGELADHERAVLERMPPLPRIHT